MKPAGHDLAQINVARLLDALEHLDPTAHAFTPKQRFAPPAAAA